MGSSELVPCERVLVTVGGGDTDQECLYIQWDFLVFFLLPGAGCCLCLPIFDQ